MANKRIFYAVQQIGFAQLGAGVLTAVHGVQSCGINTTFPLEQVFEMGQISIYANIEGIPDVEITAEKVLDGYPLIGHFATQGATTATLVGRSNQKCQVGLSIFPDTQDSASGAPVNTVVMSGMSLSAWSFNFPVDGNFTESCTIVGNHKVWYNGSASVGALPTFSGAFLNNADTPAASEGVNRRQNMIFGSAWLNASASGLDVNGAITDPNCTVLPFGVGGIPGISSSGVNVSDGSEYSAHVTSIGTSVDLSRTALNELGRKIPYHRFAQFPAQVTTTIEIISVSGDLVSATEAGVAAGGRNTTDQTIRIAVKEGTRINLGTKNRLASVQMGGGDTGGGNVTLTYTYNNFNDFTVTHSGDCTVALRAAQGGVGGT